MHLPTCRTMPASWLVPANLANCACEQACARENCQPMPARNCRTALAKCLRDCRPTLANQPALAYQPVLIELLACACRTANLRESACATELLACAREPACRNCQLVLADQPAPVGLPAPAKQPAFAKTIQTRKFAKVQEFTRTGIG